MLNLGPALNGFRPLTGYKLQWVRLQAEFKSSKVSVPLRGINCNKKFTTRAWPMAGFRPLTGYKLQSMADDGVSGVGMFPSPYGV